MPSERRRNSETNIHVYACILLHIGIEAKPRPRMRVRFALRFLASAFSKLNPCIFPSLFFFNTIFTWRIFFFFIQSSLNECRAILINHVSLYLHDLLLFVTIYLYNKSLLYSFIRMIKNGPTFAFLITINIFQLITALAENCYYRHTEIHTEKRGKANEQANGGGI